MRKIFSILLLSILLSACSPYIPDGRETKITDGLWAAPGITAPKLILGGIAVDMLIDTRMYGEWYFDDNTPAMRIDANNVLTIYTNTNVYEFQYEYFGTSAIIGNPKDSETAFGLQFIFPDATREDVAIVVLYGNGDAYLMHKNILPQEMTLYEQPNW